MEVEKKMNETTAYYDKIRKEDSDFINKEAEKYASSTEPTKEAIKQAYIDGWNRNIPNSDAIHRIVMFAYDYVPWWCNVDVTYSVKMIREILKDYDV
jgi:hypothetical protein